MIRRRGFLFVLGASVAGLWLPEPGLIALPRRMVIDLSGTSACSFCGKLVTEVYGLAGVQHRPIRICNECVGLCCDIIGEEVELDEPPAATAAPAAADELVDLQAEYDRLIAQLQVSHDELKARFGAGVSQSSRPSYDAAHPACSFCDTPQKATRHLIAGPMVHICDACIGDAASVLSAQLA